jgi:nitroimidazol reductase NimA-like FMN-containing flavoprotein (pyridoxamine 5'-phosphate oxidase superfamily)
MTGDDASDEVGAAGTDDGPADQLARPAAVDRNGLKVLDEVRCRQLLVTATVGRVGLAVGHVPVVLPVNFRVVRDRVVFRTAVGTKLDAAADGALVAFEVDDFDAMSHSGWSVVVVGPARGVNDDEALEALEAGSIPRWAKRGDDQVVEIEMNLVTGRELEPWRALDP